MSFQQAQSVCLLVILDLLQGAFGCEGRSALYVSALAGVFVCVLRVWLAGSWVAGCVEMLSIPVGSLLRSGLLVVEGVRIKIAM